MTGLISYFLPLRAGARKGWASEHFFCCHGTLVQANACHVAGLYYAAERELAVCQYFPSEVTWKAGDVPVKLRQEMPIFNSSIQAVAVETTENHHRPRGLVIEMRLSAEREIEFTLSLRLPGWIRGRARPLTMLQPDNEKEWKNWLCSYRTRNQDPGFRFIPLYKVGYERYSVYFQVKGR